MEISSNVYSVELARIYPQNFFLRYTAVLSSKMSLHSLNKLCIMLHEKGFFPCGLRLPPPIKLTVHDIIEILLKEALNTINLKPKPIT